MEQMRKKRVDSALRTGECVVENGEVGVVNPEVDKLSVGVGQLGDLPGKLLANKAEQIVETRSGARVGTGRRGRRGCE